MYALQKRKGSHISRCVIAYAYWKSYLRRFSHLKCKDKVKFTLLEKLVDLSH